ncbi:hypothetical protein B7494_g4318 [Chlorociboria aeruginascens]|nr:hypothetical protein B7494_g4318 [Chlorociboria aeruginascens]
MPLSLYEVTVPTFLHTLKALSAFLEKGRLHASSNEAGLIESRLIGDMGNLAFQIQRLSDSAKGLAVRCGKAEPVILTDNETTFPELQARIQKTVDILEKLDPKCMDGMENEVISFKAGAGEKRFTGTTYVQHFVIPNFYFHVSIALRVVQSSGKRYRSVQKTFCFENVLRVRLNRIESLDTRLTSDLRNNMRMKRGKSECAERFYGLIADDEREDEDLSIDDIESSIQNEVALLGKKDTIKLFTPVFLNIQCVLFFKTEPSIDPVDFVHRICEEIVLKPGVRRMRYVNRLTPVTMIAKASEKGLEEVGKKVLGEYFQLAGEASQQVEEKGNLDRTRYSYAIRPSIRNHTTLKRDAVIKQVASLVGEEHKVDLANPDKVIIVEIYQTVCGMSVVGNDWETLKRFNLAGLYQISGKNGDATPKPAKTDEAQSVGPRARSETTDNLT